MRAAQILIRIAIAACCIFDVWLLMRAASHGPGLMMESPSGEQIGLLPVQWAAAGFLWLGALISFQLLLVAAELFVRGLLRRRPPLAGVSPTR